MSDIFGGEEIDLDTASEVEVQREPEPVAERVAEQVEVPSPDIGETSTVPLAALNEARAQARMAQAQLQEMQKQMQPLMELRQRIEEAERRDKERQQEQEFNADPLGVIQKQQAQALREIEELKKGPPQNQEAAQQQVFQSIASQVQEFKKSTPDYDAALAHVLDARKQELMAMGAPEYEAQQRIAVEAQDIAVNALRSGQNPGQVVYQLAKLRGFQAKQTSAKLETVGKGQAASKSLSGASGGAPGVGMSLAELDNMSDDEFDSFWEKEIKPKNR
jgi:hypothetical protein